MRDITEKEDGDTDELQTAHGDPSAAASAAIAEAMSLVPKAMSFDDIQAWMPGLPVIKYSDFSTCKDIRSYLNNPYGGCIFLYETRVNSGHYCAVMKQGKGIEVFDPYGIQPDKELDLVTRDVMDQTGQTNAFLSGLLLQTGVPIHYNDHKLQKMALGISTCGRHCIVRLLRRDVDIDTYAHELRKNKLRVNPDVFVSVIVSGP